MTSTRVLVVAKLQPPWLCHQKGISALPLLGLQSSAGPPVPPRTLPSFCRPAPCLRPVTHRPRVLREGAFARVPAECAPGSHVCSLPPTSVPDASRHSREPLFHHSARRGRTAPSTPVAERAPRMVLHAASCTSGRPLRGGRCCDRVAGAPRHAPSLTTGRHGMACQAHTPRPTRSCTRSDPLSRGRRGALEPAARLRRPSRPPSLNSSCVHAPLSEWRRPARGPAPCFPGRGLTLQGHGASSLGRLGLVLIVR